MEIFLPTLNDQHADFLTIFSYFNIPQGTTAIYLNFSKCKFLKQNAVTALGSFIRFCQNQNITVAINPNSMSKDVKDNLMSNNFLPYFFPHLYQCVPPKNSIPFREDYSLTGDVLNYLSKDFLGRGWIGLSPALKAQIVNYLSEIYLNGFEHSKSGAGMITCGQFYPRLKELKLTVTDLGIGIPASINNFRSSRGEALHTGPQALMWAFDYGNSTRQTGEPGGLGLDLLKTLVKLNKGKIEVYSHNSFYVYTHQGASAGYLQQYFPGTLVNITLISDTNQYYLISEKL